MTPGSGMSATVANTLTTMHSDSDNRASQAAAAIFTPSFVRWREWWWIKGGKWWDNFGGSSFWVLAWRGRRTRDCSGTETLLSCFNLIHSASKTHCLLPPHVFLPVNHLFPFSMSTHFILLHYHPLCLRLSFTSSLSHSLSFLCVLYRCDYLVVWWQQVYEGAVACGNAHRGGGRLTTLSLPAGLRRSHGNHIP